jgi:hypothetical protein
MKVQKIGIKLEINGEEKKLFVDTSSMTNMELPASGELNAFIPHYSLSKAVLAHDQPVTDEELFPEMAKLGKRPVLDIKFSVSRPITRGLQGLKGTVKVSGIVTQGQLSTMQALDPVERDLIRGIKAGEVFAVWAE